MYQQFESARRGPRQRDPAAGFKLETSGTLNGQVVRVSYTQVAATSDATPFKQLSSPGEYRVGFEDVYCMTWTTRDPCIAADPHPHALQIWIVGGDVEGDFEFCIDGIYPML
jgi:hypothetical protein